MAKRIRMITPFDIMRGNVSGKQKLEYPKNGNGAYEAPLGKNYAQNYKPSFIVAERQSDGRAYFQVRKRSCYHRTAKSTMAMAVLGATGAIIGAILSDKTSALYIALEAIFTGGHWTKNGKAMTFRQFLAEFTMNALKAKSPVIVWAGVVGSGVQSVTLNNPYVSGGTGTYNVTISNDILVKFWNALANNPITFTVEGQKGVAHAGNIFNDIVGSRYNVLGMTLSGETDNYVMIGDLYVHDGDAFVFEGDEVISDFAYTLKESVE